jgi:hypothetical protein
VAKIGTSRASYVYIFSLDKASILSSGRELKQEKRQWLEFITRLGYFLVHLFRIYDTHGNSSSDQI